MTPDDFAEAMKKLAEFAEHGDTEGAHTDMDNLMCTVLEALGYGEGVKIFRDAKKWYA